MAVHRYKANESDGEAAETKKAAPKKVAKVVKEKVEKPAKTGKTAKIEQAEKKPVKFLAPFKAIKNYFVGSWRELRQVRWPNRKQTWAMTLVVLLFSLFLGVLIFLLDAGFTMLFKKIIF